MFQASACPPRPCSPQKLPVGAGESLAPRLSAMLPHIVVCIWVLLFYEYFPGVRALVPVPTVDLNDVVGIAEGLGLLTLWNTMRYVLNFAD
eukprot:6875009-Pyramimonas_sp.AAC.1